LIQAQRTQPPLPKVLFFRRIRLTIRLSDFPDNCNSGRRRSPRKNIRRGGTRKALRVGNDFIN
jgi:hypothetical protein